MASTEYQIKIHHVGNVFSQEEPTAFPTMSQLIFPFSSRKGKIDLSKRVENVINSLRALLKDFENIKTELDCRMHQDKENQSTNQMKYEFSFERTKEALPLSLMTKDLQRQLKETFDTYKDLKRAFNSGGNEIRREHLRVRSQNARDSTLLDFNKLVTNSPSERSPQSKLHILIDKENETLSIVPDKVSILSAFVEEELESSPYRANDPLFKDISPIHLPQTDTTFSRHCYLLGAENSDCGDEKSFRIQLQDEIKNTLLRPDYRSFNKSNSNFKQPSVKAETDKDMSTELSIEFEVAEETQQLPLTTMILEHLD